MHHVLVGSYLGSEDALETVRKTLVQNQYETNPMLYAPPFNQVVSTKMRDTRYGLHTKIQTKTGSFALGLVPIGRQTFDFVE